jgi:hypothetical protein
VRAVARVISTVVYFLLPLRSSGQTLPVVASASHMPWGLSQTFSSYKHAVRAAEHKKPIAILNAGVTRADHLASLVVHADCTKALPALVTALDGPRM